MSNRDVGPCAVGPRGVRLRALLTPHACGFGEGALRDSPPPISLRTVRACGVCARLWPQGTEPGQGATLLPDPLSVDRERRDCEIHGITVQLYVQRAAVSYLCTCLLLKRTRSFSKRSNV